MSPQGIAWLAAGLSLGMAAVGTAFAIGNLASKSVEAMARQPEAKATIQKTMVIAIAFIEALCLYTFVVAMVLASKKDESAVVESAVPPAAAVSSQAH
jgi:F-type H+-transporting ATPase subunit c